MLDFIDSSLFNNFYGHTLQENSKNVHTGSHLTDFRV